MTAQLASYVQPVAAASEQASRQVGELAAALDDLALRGIREPGQFAPLGVDAIRGAVRWFDAQRGRVGAGVLFAELRAGGKPGWQSPRSSSDRQRDYWRSLEAWLEGAFPEFGAHPAAAAAVMRLHRRHGRGSVTRREHGPIIRAAVDRWERRYA